MFILYVLLFTILPICVVSVKVKVFKKKTEFSGHRIFFKIFVDILSKRRSKNMAGKGFKIPAN